MATEVPAAKLRLAAKPDIDSGRLREGLVDLETGLAGAGMGPEVSAQGLFRDRFVGLVRMGHDFTPARDRAGSLCLEMTPGGVPARHVLLGQARARRLLGDETRRAEAVAIVRSLIARIEVRAGKWRGAPQVILVGDLARVLDYACAQQKTAASGGGGGRVLLVAGAATDFICWCKWQI